MLPTPSARLGKTSSRSTPLWGREVYLTDVTQKFNSWKSKPYYFGIAQEVMLYQKIGFAEFRWDYFAYGS
jgi:hypothetical protein